QQNDDRRANTPQAHEYDARFNPVRVGRPAGAFDSQQRQPSINQTDARIQQPQEQRPHRYGWRYGWQIKNGSEKTSRFAYIVQQHRQRQRDDDRQGNVQNRIVDAVAQTLSDARISREFLIIRQPDIVWGTKNIIVGER